MIDNRVLDFDPIKENIKAEVEWSDAVRQVSGQWRPLRETIYQVSMRNLDDHDSFRKYIRSFIILHATEAAFILIMLVILLLKR